MLFGPNSLTLLPPNNVGRGRAGSRDAGRLSGGLGLCSWDPADLGRTHHHPADQLLTSRGWESAAAKTRLLKRVVEAKLQSHFKAKLPSEKQFYTNQVL